MIVRRALAELAKVFGRNVDAARLYRHRSAGLDWLKAVAADVARLRCLLAQLAYLFERPGAAIFGVGRVAFLMAAAALSSWS